MKFRPLGIAKEIVEDTGLEVTYTYDDLMFIQHNAFLIQFDDEDEKRLKLFFNVNCEANAAREVEDRLISSAKQRKFIVQNTGNYEMVEQEGSEELQIKFIPAV